MGSIEPMAFLPVGNSLSYGDVRDNDRGMLIEARRHNRILAFNPGPGVVRCAAAPSATISTAAITMPVAPSAITSGA